MELVEGETLQQRLSKGPLPVDEALGVCRQIAEGLEAAHEKGVIHRDLKPANVMISDGDKVKILDFGLAKALSEETQSIDSSQSPTLTEAMTRPGVILGTAAYMSPEQAKGKAVDKRADIWAFGCILYECLTGKRAFEGETVTETLAAVLTKEPEWEKIPAKVQPLLRRCLERDPKKRLRDIGDAMAWIDFAPVIAPESTPAKRPGVWKSIAILFIVAFAVVTFVHFHEKPLVPNQPIRSQIMLPPKVKLPFGEAFTLSPDGNRLAFWGEDPDRVLRLWIRAFDSGEARPLPGTDSRGATLFWSPDSRYVAYGAGGKLKKINVNGGPAKEICDLSKYAIGGSWNRDGVIIFGDYKASNRIMRVPDSGGTPSPVTILRDNDISHVFPVFLPDGRHFLYLRRSNIPKIEGVYVGTLDSKPEEQDTKQLVATTSMPVYVPSQDSDSGYLLFLSGQTLMAQPFNHRRLELTGEAVPVVSNVGNYNSMGYFSASANGYLIYRSELDAQLSRPTWVDRQGNRKAVAKEGYYNGLALSPEDERLAVAGYQNDLQSHTHLDIYLIDLLSGIYSRLTVGQSQNTTPILSRDGRVVFSSNRDGPMNLYEKQVNDAKGEKLLVESMDDKLPTSISKDGSFLLYTANNPKTQYDIWMLPIGGKKVPFWPPTDFSESDGRFSPDMRWMAYVSDETGRSEIYIREIIRISEKSLDAGMKWWRPISQDGGMAPRWKGDSKELYYRALDGKVMAVEIKPGAQFQPGTPKTLFPADTSEQSTLIRHWDVTSDGNRFLLLVPDAESSLSPFNVIQNWTSLLQK
jgi:eukaryotic-like serine/threonine-protein kinase